MKAILKNGRLAGKANGPFAYLGERMNNRLTQTELQKIIDENPLRSLSSIGEETGNSRVTIEKMLKTYKLDEYRNRKIKRLRGDKARKRRDYQN